MGFVCASTVDACLQSSYLFFFFCSQYAIQSSSLASAAVATVTAAALRRSLLRMIPNFIFLIPCTHTHVRRTSTIHITYRITTQNGFKAEFLFCAESIFFLPPSSPLLLVLLYWSLSLLSLTCILCERNILWILDFSTWRYICIHERHEYLTHKRTDEYTSLRNTFSVMIDYFPQRFISKMWILSTQQRNGRSKCERGIWKERESVWCAGA